MYRMSVISGMRSHSVLKSVAIGWRHNYQLGSQDNSINRFLLMLVPPRPLNWMIMLKK